MDDPASPNVGVADPPDYPFMVDMGAYEFPADCGPCPWDTFPVDGNVGAGDLAFLLGNWEPIPPDPDPRVLCLDMEPNGVIGAFDLANLLGNWGPCPDP